MARFYPLFSSSSGNCSYIGDENGGILIDAGVSCKRICIALNECGINPNAVKAIFITHTHGDHINGLKVFVKKYGCAVFAQEVNLRQMILKGKLQTNAEIYPIEKGKVTIGSMTVSHFETSHDTEASCGYCIEFEDGKKAVTCTDLGEITSEVRNAVDGADVILLESNYDENMLKKGSYPYYLKRRILSSSGHLSNDDCGEELRRLIENGTKRFILGHLSRENNTPELAERSAVDALSGYIRNHDYTLDIAAPENTGKAVIF